MRASTLIALAALVGVVACGERPALLVTRHLGPHPRTRITHVLVWDGRADELIPPKDVIVENGRITAMLAPGLAPAGELVIDGTGKVLMPGLMTSTATRARTPLRPGRVPASSPTPPAICRATSTLG